MREESDEGNDEERFIRCRMVECPAQVGQEGFVKSGSINDLFG